MGFRLVTRVGAATRNPLKLAWLAEQFLRGVISNNRMTIRERKRQGCPVPPLYRSGVKYEQEPGPNEEFADLLTVLRRGWGDCDDLVAWRCAELQEAGVRAQARIYWREPKGDGVWRMHAQVRHPDPCKCRLCRRRPVRGGRIEDPSRFLGL